MMMPKTWVNMVNLVRFHEIANKINDLVRNGQDPDPEYKMPTSLPAFLRLHLSHINIAVALTVNLDFKVLTDLI